MYKNLGKPRNQPNIFKHYSQDITQLQMIDIHQKHIWLLGKNLSRARVIDRCCKVIPRKVILSKDDGTKKVPYLRMENLKNHTPSNVTYPCSLHMVSTYSRGCGSNLMSMSVKNRTTDLPAKPSHTTSTG